MERITYDKLVRNNIPEIIRADGSRPIFRTIEGGEFRRALLQKLVEEAQELLESNGDLSERADIAEVLMAIDQELGFTEGDIEQCRTDKHAKRGGFEKHIFLEATESDE